MAGELPADTTYQSDLAVGHLACDYLGPRPLEGKDDTSRGKGKMDVRSVCAELPQWMPVGFSRISPGGTNMPADAICCWPTSGWGFTGVASFGNENNPVLPCVGHQRVNNRVWVTVGLLLSTP